MSYYIETKALNRKEIAEEFMTWILTATHVMEHGKSIIFVWYDSKQMCVKKAYISNEEELYNALCEINIYEGKDKNTITDMGMLMKMEKRV